MMAITFVFLALAATVFVLSHQMREQRPITTIWYRTQDGEDYRFALEYLRAGYRVYVLECASERARSAPHLLHDRNGPYICWSCAIQTEEAALTIASQWSEA